MKVVSGISVSHVHANLHSPVTYIYQINSFTLVQESEDTNITTLQSRNFHSVYQILKIPQYSQLANQTSYKTHNT